MLEIDGSRFSGSGTIVRQAVALSALTGQDVHITEARCRRPSPGLRAQHVWVVEALRRLVDGTTAGNCVGCQDLTFRPGAPSFCSEYTWDIGSAGSTTLLALAVLPVLVFAPWPVSVELRGGLFQDFAPSFHHLRRVTLPLLWRMGANIDIRMHRPGFVPEGKGVIRLQVRPMHGALRPLVAEAQGSVNRIWGVAFSSRLDERKVALRMAKAAQAAFSEAGYESDFELVHDRTAVQAGAAMAAFADLAVGTRLGADRAGAPRRRAEGIGAYVARQLVEDLKTGATVDRYAADQVLMFAALADGESRFVIPRMTDHIRAGAWLLREFMGVDIQIHGQDVTVAGAAVRPELLRPEEPTPMSLPEAS